MEATESYSALEALLNKNNVARLLPAPSEEEVLAIDVFPCLLDIGEAMLKCGADVHYIEEVLVKTGRSYGAYKMNVFVITSAIVATMTLSNGREYTLTRRVFGDGGINFGNLEALSRLCRECRHEHLGPKEIRIKLEIIITKPLPSWALYVGGVLSAGGFALFFGGSVLDSFVSALFAIVLCFAIKHFKPWTPNTMIFNFGSSFIVGLAIIALSHVIPSISSDMVMIGDIMLLIPGVAMTNATRDMLSGDTLSGLMRFVESLLWATSLALGFMGAMWLAGALM